MFAINYKPHDLTVQVMSSNNSDPLASTDPLLEGGGSLIQANFMAIADRVIPRNVVFGINGSFVFQTATSLTNPVQITKTGVVISAVGIVLTPYPTVTPAVFSVCKNVLAYSAESIVVTFSVAANGTVTPTLASGGTIANLSLIAGDQLTIYCNQIGTVPGSNGNFTLTVV